MCANHLYCLYKQFQFIYSHLGKWWPPSEPGGRSVDGGLGQEVQLQKLRIHYYVGISDGQASEWRNLWITIEVKNRVIHLRPIK